MTKRIATLVLLALLLPTATAGEGSGAAPEATVERILELQRQIDELMATLPPEIRDHLRRRLAETAAKAAPEDSEPAAQEPAAAETPTALASAEPAATEPAPPATAAGPQAAPAPPPVETAVAEASPGAVEAPVPGAPAAEAATPSDIPRLLRRRSKRPPCNTLSRLDENGDGKINSADRYWRHVYLWTDKNGDGQIQEREVESAYDERVREIAVSLETFTRARGGLGEIRVEDKIVLDLRGDGFSERSRRDDGVLVIDAGALGRGDGPRLLDPGGQPLSGLQPFRSGLRLDLAGAVTELNCP